MNNNRIQQKFVSIDRQEMKNDAKILDLFQFGKLLGSKTFDASSLR